MNREIKFRGLRTDGNGWIYGNLIIESLIKNVNGEGYIRHSIKQFSPDRAFYKDTFEVMPESIGQYTGLKDKNGKDIYEGDVMKSLGTDICVVRWIKDLACFMLENINPTDEFENILIPLHKGYEHREVVGNIFNNPELI